MSTKEIRRCIEKGAREQFSIDSVVRKYMSAIEEIINVPRLLEVFDIVVKAGKAKEVLSEIIRWSQVEFNYTEEDEIEGVVEGDDDEK